MLTPGTEYAHQYLRSLQSSQVYATVTGSPGIPGLPVLGSTLSTLLETQALVDTRYFFFLPFSTSDTCRGTTACTIYFS